MPELPEVQTVVDGLQKSIKDKQIEKIVQHRENTVEEKIKCQNYGKVKAVQRRGKFIIIEARVYIIIHLRMTGKLKLVNKNTKPGKYTRAEILFKDDTKLLFDDVRTFGTIAIVQSLENYDSLRNMSGVEPLTDAFDDKYLGKVLKNRKAPIKNLLLNQKIIAGLGNIYACEILYRAKVDPSTSAKKLSLKQIDRIIRQTKIVLKEAIEQKGTTVSDFRGISGKTGQFQKSLQVYKQEHCNCGKEIKKIKQAGRSTYYCPKCQK